MAERATGVLSDPSIVGVDIAEALKEARKAYLSVNRKGFTDERVENPEITQAFVIGVQALLELREQLSLFCNVLSKSHLPCRDWKQQFQSDCTTFRRQFYVLYGEPQ